MAKAAVAAPPEGLTVRPLAGCNSRRGSVDEFSSLL
jgi:hypothetical protein